MSPGTRTPAPRECSVAAALDVIGEKWSLLVVRELFLGARKFNDIAANTGAPRDVLTARLRRLEELGVIERRVYSQRPVRHLYVLTDKGKDLRPVMLTLKQWGDTHVTGRVLPPSYEHTCGAAFEPAMHCKTCGEAIDARSLRRGLDTQFGPLLSGMVTIGYIPTTQSNRYLRLTGSFLRQPPKQVTVVLPTSDAAVRSSASRVTPDPVAQHSVTPDSAAPDSAAPRRWIGVGRSSSTNAIEAGQAAATEAASHSDPKLFIVFAAATLDLSGVATGVGAVAGSVPVVGCSTAGEIATSGPSDDGVVVLALGGQGFGVAASVALNAGERLRDAGAEAAACIRDLGTHEHRLLLLLTDGLAGDQQEIVRGAYSEVGAEVPLVGGCAGDGMRMQRTSVFFDGQVHHNAVVAVALGSDGPFGIGVRHGWRRVGEPMLVTESSDNRVHGLDDEPALDVYLRRLQAPAEAWHDPAAFTQFALTHPLGVSRRSGEEVRFVAEADFVERSLVCIAQVPAGGSAWMMEGDDASVLAASDMACDEALEQLDGTPPLGLLAFDCIARRGVLGEEGIHREIERIADRAGGTPVAGFYTYGEIARRHGTGGFHNQTLVVLALG